MATPSSSATTPSPQLRHMQPHTPTAASATAPNPNSPDDKEERDRAVQKFLARAELAKLTRGLRTRLSYATFKAMHNLSNTTLRDLENDPQSQFRANKPGNYYNNPATQGNSAMTPGGSTRTPSRKGPMAPPPPVTASAAQSLFSSILAPPPSKRARTIHNPEDPPVPAPTKPRSNSPQRKVTKSSRPADGAPAKSKSRKSKDGAKGKGKQAIQDSEESAADVDIDMRAAATLTSLLLSSRPSISLSASSPRSSVSGGSDAGSAQSYAHFAQSSTRTLTAAPSTLSSEASFNMSRPRRSTPPPLSPAEASYRQSFTQPSSMRTESRGTPKARRRGMYPAGESGTPHPPSDTEAADSLLFLATSPSPVRPTSTRDKDAKDMAAFRALGGGSALKGRVLFPTHDGDDATVATSRALRRDDTGSFASTVSAASSDFAPGGSFPHIYNKHVASRPASRSSNTPSAVHDSAEGTHLDTPMEPTVTPPTPTDVSPAQLLPAPPSPMRTERSHESSRSNSAERPSAAPMPPAQARDAKKPGNAPPTPGNASFNLSDFINVSPSPAAAAGSSSRLSSTHVDIGRRLFEEHHGVNGASAGSNPKSGLGAGIDLVKS